MCGSDDQIDASPLTTGVAGIDDIVRGGLPHDYLDMVTNTPGSGKTTLAMQFLLEGRVGSVNPACTSQSPNRVAKF